MTRRRLRSLKPEERKLWDRVAATATPLRPNPTGQPEKNVRPEDGKGPADAAPAMPDIARPQPVARPAAKPRAPQPPRLDARLHRRMRQGKLRPEARLDLHGMRLDQAHAALLGFVMRAHGRGYRQLLVITGKGRDGADDAGPIPESRGVLRRQVPHWLTMPPLAPLVQEVVPAHRSHGGAGALYVYLKKPSRPGP